MAHCSGCGIPLSWKKYRFQRMWKIPGYFCKKCMLDLGKDFDKYGRIVTPARPCDLCSVEFYFLKAVTKEHKRQHYCHVCHESVVSSWKCTTRQIPGSENTARKVLTPL